MDFLFGVMVGVIATLAAGGLAAWLLNRRDAALPVPVEEHLPGEAAVAVMMLESFLNHQLRDALADEAIELQLETQEATHARLPLKLKLNSASLDVQPGRRAVFTAQLTVSAWGLQLGLRPTTEFLFVLQGEAIKLRVVTVRVAGFNVPRALVDRFVSEVVETAEARLNHSLMLLQRDTHVKLSDLETTEDLMILKFVQGKDGQ
jgi:hypothetical protein